MKTITFAMAVLLSAGTALATEPNVAPAPQFFGQTVSFFGAAQAVQDCPAGFT